jgi:HAD superfamily hydrolase (TIGR01549 family)
MTTRWNPFVKQIVAVAGLVAVIWLLFRIEALLTPLILTFLLAYLLALPVHFITRHTGWHRTLVTGLIYLVLLVVIITAPVVLVPRLVNLVVALGNTLLNLITELTSATPQPIHLTPALTLDLGPYYAPMSQWLRGLLAPDVSLLQNLQNILFPFATGAAVVVRGAVSGLLALFLILFVSFYLVKDWPMIGRWTLTRLPEPFRPELHSLWSRLADVWDAFVRGQLTLGLVMGVVTWLMTSILGIRNAPALGLLSGLAEFVPGVGPTIAGIIGTLIAFFTGSVWLQMPRLGFAALTAAAYFLLSQIENLYLVPRVVGRRVALHPIVIIIGALVGAHLGGVLGILLAAPTIASIRLLFGYAFCKLLNEDPFPPQPTAQDRASAWRALVARQHVRGVLFDLDGTLIETDDALVNKLASRLAFLSRIMPAQEQMRLARRWLMASEVLVNAAITLLDWLYLDNLLFRLNDTLRRWRGLRRPDDFVAMTGTPEMLHELAGRYRLAVVTSRSRKEADRFLARYGLSDLFYAIITRDDVSRLKPHPMPVVAAGRKIGLPLSQCVMVGDTNVDVRSAKAAGALAVGVLCGFGESVDLQNADLVIGSTAELGKWL